MGKSVHPWLQQCPDRPRHPPLPHLQHLHLQHPHLALQEEGQQLLPSQPVLPLCHHHRHRHLLQLPLPH